MNPVDREVEIKCPLCESGFVEEIDANSWDSHHRDSNSDFWSDRAFFLWAPILLGITHLPRCRRRLRPLEFYDDDDEDENEDGESHREGDTELDHEIESIFRRRRAGTASEYDGGDWSCDGGGEGDDDGYGDWDQDRDREREHVIMINPFTQTLVIHSRL